MIYRTHDMLMTFCEIKDVGKDTDRIKKPEPWPCTIDTGFLVPEEEVSKVPGFNVRL